ncbi:HlyD family secretion protein [Siccirubricoccus sp. KC 17139]|uniref:HlyD family secretion protein n=1 Tax=Siccirubricoccus soli TaxID=2899147 RepID=A0ABT1CZD2_9PROT|nr:HlyD family secretion protein [Siccirubricoccus soli]MCO6415023.1 HlyD family secretion protein [Siccirubricoccus soli]MCP2681154.1 HlyD family secretion protein [Siccirubricoccus soli]
MDVGPGSVKSLAPDAAARRMRRLRLLALMAALLALLAGAAWFTHRLFTLVVVDDARVAADMITIASRVPGWVAEVRVIAGDTPGKGSLLLRIDSRESEIALREIEARLATLAARRAELEARLSMVDRQTESAAAGTRAKLEVARAALPAAIAERVLAEAEHERAQMLVASGSGTRQRQDQTRSGLDMARQKVLAATAEILNAEAQIAASEAAREELVVLRRQLEALGPQQQELEAQRDRAALDLADRRIVMPFDGSIDRVFVDPGEYVAAGQRLLMLHDPARVRVEANVKETEIRWFRPGTHVQVTVDALPGQRFEGVVERVAGAATSEFALLPSPNPSGNFTKITQRLPVRVALQPPPAPGLLRPGMMVQIEAAAIE